MTQGWSAISREKGGGRMSVSEALMLMATFRALRKAVLERDVLSERLRDPHPTGLNTVVPQ